MWRRCSRCMPRGGEQGSFDTGIERAVKRLLVSPRVPVPRRARSRRRGARTRRTGSATSSSPRGCRSSCGAAFPTTNCWTLAEKGRLREPAVLGRAGPADAGRSAVRDVRDELRRSVAVSAQPAEHRTRSTKCFRISTTGCGRRFSARPSCSSTASCARIARALELLTADYTFLNERSGAALRDPRTSRAVTSGA